ncbi:Mov34/MPN/PAD-1 family protein [Paenibacillus sp. NPDC057934]|uniref:Mov34/MPN/PAD-1 family protein n=1 Tax=Paenibacillus sp. NPDC057934 TaxID=3346282 RepID=UPI0036D8F3F9
MTDKIYYHNDFAYTVLLENELINQMLNFCRAKMPLETGGILVGEYSKNALSARIMYISGPPQDSKHRTHEFYRGTHNLESLLSDFWEKGLFYLGEWHFHPKASPNPSLVDRKQMRKISNGNNYNCPEPILLILGGDPNEKWHISCSIFSNKHGWIELMEDR